MIKPLMKIDYYSAMLYNCRLSRVLEKFGYTSENLEFFREAVAEAVPGILSNIDRLIIRLPEARFLVKFSDLGLPGVTLKAIASDSETFCNGEFEEWASKFLDIELEVIKIESAGQELDYQRSRGIDPDQYAFSETYWDDVCVSSLSASDLKYSEDMFKKQWKVTRCDFAFDFVDCEEFADFPQVLVQQLCKCQSEGILNLLNGHTNGLRYAPDYQPNVTCCYLGTKGTPEFLRIYDKFQQICSENHVSDSKLWPEGRYEHHGCKSWFRFELQARATSGKLQKLLYSGSPGTSAHDRMAAIWNHIIDQYSVSDVKGEVFPFLQRFYAAVDVSNLHFVQLGTYVDMQFPEIIRDPSSFIFRNLTGINLCLAELGVKGFLTAVNDANLNLAIARSERDLRASRKLYTIDMAILNREMFLNKKFGNSGYYYVRNGIRQYILTAEEVIYYQALSESERVKINFFEEIGFDQVRDNIIYD